MGFAIFIKLLDKQTRGRVVNPGRGVARSRLVPIHDHARHSPLVVVGEAHEIRPAALVGLSALEIVLVNRGMEQISRRIIFNTLTATRLAKPLTNEVLGLS